MKQPPPFDFTPHKFTIVPGQNPPWHADLRHIYALHDLARHLPQNGRIVEVGSFRGASTVAFIEAINLRPDLSLDIYEPRPTEELRYAVSRCEYPGKINIFPRPLDADLGGVQTDLVFIDADHGWPAFRDLAICLAQDVPLISLHDTAGLHGSFGSQEAAIILKSAEGRDYIEDAQARPGEATERGLGLAYFDDGDETWPQIMEFWANADIDLSPMAI